MHARESEAAVRGCSLCACVGKAERQRRSCPRVPRSVVGTVFSLRLSPRFPPSHFRLVPRHLSAESSLSFEHRAQFFVIFLNVFEQIFQVVGIDVGRNRLLHHHADTLHVLGDARGVVFLQHCSRRQARVQSRRVRLSTCQFRAVVQQRSSRLLSTSPRPGDLASAFVFATVFFDLHARLGDRRSFAHLLFSACRLLSVEFVGARVSSVWRPALQ